jgi:hypothetical protein
MHLLHKTNVTFSSDTYLAKLNTLPVSDIFQLPFNPMVMKLHWCDVYLVRVKRLLRQHFGFGFSLKLLISLI